MAVMLECCGRLSGLYSAFDKHFRVVLSLCVGCEGVLGRSALSQVSVILQSVDVALVVQRASVGFYGPAGKNVASDPLLWHKRPIFLTDFTAIFFHCKGIFRFTLLNLSLLQSLLSVSIKTTGLDFWQFGNHGQDRTLIKSNSIYRLIPICKSSLHCKGGTEPTSEIAFGHFGGISFPKPDINSSDI